MKKIPSRRKSGKTSGTQRESRLIAPQYVLFHKPYDVLSQFTDREGRRTLADYIAIPNIYSVGRLDRDSEGLLLLTSDGKVTHRMASPAFKVFKTYWVQVEGIPEESVLLELRKGVMVRGKKALPAKVQVLSSEPRVFPRPVPIRFRKTVPTSWLQIEIQEGMNRQIRRMTAQVGHPTLRVIRVGIGPLRLGSLKPGEWRRLRPAEIKTLYSGGFAGGLLKRRG